VIRNLLLVVCQFGDLEIQNSGISYRLFLCRLYMRQLIDAVHGFSLWYLIEFWRFAFLAMRNWSFF
jgi:hypothetical protein